MDGGKHALAYPIGRGPGNEFVKGEVVLCAHHAIMAAGFHGIEGGTKVAAVAEGAGGVALLPDVVDEVSVNG